MTEDYDDEAAMAEARLEALKAQADNLGISYHPSIGEDKLRAKVQAKLEESEKAQDDEDEQGTPQISASAAEPVKAVPETEAQLRYRKKKEASALIRVRVTNMNPSKREWEGEIFTASNSVVGTFRKHVPFGVEWHVPKIILNQIKQRKYRHTDTVKDSRGNPVPRNRMINEFAVEILPPLTKDELKDLAQRQAMANGTSAG